MQYLYVYNRAPTDVWWQFSRVPCKCALLIPPPTIRSCVSLSLSVQYRSDAHISSKHLYIRCVIPAKHLPPLNLPFERPPLSLLPFTRYKNTVVLTVLLYSRFKKRPIIPPTERECF